MRQKTVKNSSTVVNRQRLGENMNSIGKVNKIKVSCESLTMVTAPLSLPSLTYSLPTDLWGWNLWAYDKGNPPLHSFLYLVWPSNVK